MISNISFCCFPVLLLLHLAGAKPLLSDLQSLQQLLEEDERNNVPFYASEEEMGRMDAQRKDNLNAEEKSVFDAAAAAVAEEEEEGPQNHRQRWETAAAGDDAAANSALAAGKENLLARLLKDLARTSKRSWSRYKKGGMRSCFGVRLERIGSFSGLGC